MGSSTHDHGHVSAPSTTAPPPTPTNGHTHPDPSTANPDLLSHLLRRLPPSLSLPTLRLPTAASPPVISLLSDALSASLRSASAQLGYFQLASHSVPPHLARSAESETESLFISHPNHSVLPRDFPVGYDDYHDLFCFDSASFTESTRSLSELAQELERVGMEILKAVGFGNPAREVRSLMWVSKSGRADESTWPSRVYPYAVGLQYQIRCGGKVSLLADSGWISVSPKVDSILITFGDIAQVWSNGKIKKVRGWPVPIISEEVPNNSTENPINCISMTLLLTLPLESIVSPQMKSVECEKDGENEEDTIMFDSFPFEDYAWRVYHERLHLDDPLDPYRLV